MKVVVISSLAANLINFCGPLLTAMVEAGHHVVAFAPDGDEVTVSRLALMGVTFRELPLDRRGLNPLSDVRLFLTLIALMREFAPDAVLSYSIKPVVYGSLAAAVSGVPIVEALVMGLGYVFSGDSLKQRLLRGVSKALYRVALGRARTVFFQNPDDRAVFLDSRLVGPNTRTVLVNGTGIDLDHYRPAPPVTDKPVFLLMTRLIREKGIAEFAEAARIVKRKHPEATFRLLGMPEPSHSGVPRAEIEAWVAEGLIEYLGETRDVRPYLAEASVFVLPSYYREGVPRSIQEAMAVGRPIVTTDAPGCRETVEPGHNGFLVPPKDAERLAAALTHFIEEPAEIARMGANSLAIARERYDVHQVNRAFLASWEGTPVAPQMVPVGS